MFSRTCVKTFPSSPPCIGNYLISCLSINAWVLAAPPKMTIHTACQDPLKTEALWGIWRFSNYLFFYEIFKHMTKLWNCRSFRNCALFNKLSFWLSLYFQRLEHRGFFFGNWIFYIHDVLLNFLYYRYILIFSVKKNLDLLIQILTFSAWDGNK